MGAQLDSFFFSSCCTNEEIQIPDVTTRSRLRSVKDHSHSPPSLCSNDSKSSIAMLGTAVDSENISCETDNDSSGGSKSNELTAPLLSEYKQQSIELVETNQEENSLSNDIIDEQLTMNTVRVKNITTYILSPDNNTRDEVPHIQRNPTFNTIRLNEVSGDLFDDMCKELEIKRKQLLSLNEWLEKKQSSIPYGWSKRWVLLRDGYILYNNWEITVKNEVDSAEKKRWSKCIDLGDQKTSVYFIECKRKNEFKLKTKNREYKFKTSGKDQRDSWVKAIKKHISYGQERCLFASDA